LETRLTSKDPNKKKERQGAPINLYTRTLAERRQNFRPRPDNVRTSQKKTKKPKHQTTQSTLVKKKPARRQDRSGDRKTTEQWINRGRRRTDREKPRDEIRIAKDP